jgi:Big-like domain-containing protein/polysaccharide deacetylase
MNRIACVVIALVIGSCAFDTSVSAEDVTSPTVLVLTFDDTFADQFQVRSMLSDHRMHATFFVNSIRFGGDIYMTRAQVVALAGDGNEIGGHTLHHDHLPLLDRDVARREICNDRNALLAGGFAATSFAYPFGDDTHAITDIVTACGYNSGRDVGGLGCNGCPLANTNPPDNRASIRTAESIKAEDTLATLQGYVTRAEQSGGGWVPLVFHHVCDGCDAQAIAPATLDAFLDWLAARAGSGTTVATMNAFVGGTQQPAVAAPPPFAVDNGSLELDIDRDAVPDCWQRGGSGTNTADYTLTSNAADGDTAQRIDVTALQSGARRLVTAQDSGACAPRAFPGHRYNVAASYLSTTQPVFSIYYRTTAGAWRFFAQSPAFPAASTYASARYTTPALPADAAAISFGMSILAVGSVTFDALSLADSVRTPPTIALTAPTGGSFVRGTLTLAATATDDQNVDHVEFRVADRLVGWADTAPYRLAWDTREASGAVVVTARAFDAEGTATSAAATITVDNVAPSTASISSPAANATVTGTTPIVATVADNVGVTRVRFYLDGVQLGTRTTTPYRWNWNTTTTTTGGHVLAIQAEDAAGNARRSVDLTVIVSR